MGLAAVLKFVDDEVQVFFTFHRPTIEALKALRIGAKWDKAASCWVVPGAELDPVISLLDAMEYVWELSDGPRPSYDSWSEAMFARAPQRLHLPLFRAVAHVVHPDHSGDESMMRELADTWNSRDRGNAHTDFVGS